MNIISDSSHPFRDRSEAGRLLAAAIDIPSGRMPVVLGIPRGGVIVAREIALIRKAPLDVVLTHKLGAPGNRELAVGSVSENGRVYVNRSVAGYAGADADYIEREKAYQLQEISRKVGLYRSILPKVPLEGKIVIVTDDGVATGATMQAALWAIGQEKPDKVILALPVGPEDSVRRLSAAADETICLRVPPYFDALGRFYLNFSQVEDEQLVQILKNEGTRRHPE